VILTIGLTLFADRWSLVRDIPANIRPLGSSNHHADAMQQPIRLGSEQRRRLSHLLQLEQPRELRLATCLHLMLLFGPNAELRIDNTDWSARLIDVITDSQIGDRFLQERYIAKSRDGVHFTAAGPEAHCDQCLATLATIGTPLSQPVFIDGETFSVRDMLAYSTAAFYLKNDELQWTFTAYATYMSGAARWTNAFGQRCSLDDVVAELLSRPITEETCGGAHRLSALTRFVVGCRTGMLESSMSIQQRVEEYLHTASIAVANSQWLTGAIDDNWWSRIGLSDTSPPTGHFDKPSIRVTAHLAEWLSQLPPDLQCTQASLAHARKWLSHEIATATPDTIRADLCPYAHALLACAGSHR
jgi:hypothetical protein